MKNGMKRLTAIMLLVCLLSSFVVPATFADTTEGNEIVYDLEVYNNDRYKPMIGTRSTYTLSRTAEGALSGIYTKGQSSMSILAADYPAVLNWKIEGFDSSMTEANLTLYATNNTGMRIQKPASDTAAGWIAFRLNVPQAGTYDLGLVSEGPAHTHNATAYVFPADADQMSEQTIEDKMTDSNMIGSTNTTIEELVTLTYSNVEIASDGEYILALKMSETTGKTTLWLSQITLSAVSESGETTAATTAAATTEATTVETTAAATTTETTGETTAPGGSDKVYTDGVYDIELYNYDRYQPMVGTRDTFALSRGAEGAYGSVYTSANLGYEIIANDYASDVLNWKVEGFDSTMGYANITLYAKANTGARIQKPATDEAVSGWVAFRIALPEAGKYDLSLTTEASWGAHNVYVFPADSATMSETAIEEKLTENNLAAIAAATSGHTADAPYTATYQSVDFTAGGAYIIVLKMPESAGKTTIYLSQMALTAATDGEEPTQPTTQPTEPEEELIPGGAVTENFFDMELYHYEAFANMAGVELGYTKDYNATDSVQEYLAKSYPDNVNWQIEGYTEGGILYFRGKTKQGLRAEVGAGNYLALRLNITKAANYHISFNSCYSYAYTATAYMIPAPEASMTADQIKAAITDSNKLGAINITSENRKSTVLDYPIDAAGEYIVILVAGEKDRIYLSSIGLTEVGAEVPKEPVDKVVYDFDLVGIQSDIRQSGFSNWYDAETKTMRISQKVAQWYDEDVLQWKYEGRSETAITEAIRENYLRFKATEDMIEVDDAWNAFRLEAPGAGTYDVRLTAVGNNTAVLNIYLIPAVTGVSMTTEQIQAGMTKDNLLISKARISGEDTFYLGEYTFGTEYEYVLVLEFVRGTRLNLTKIEVTRDGLVADGTLPVGKTYNGIVYDLDLADSFDGIFYGKSRFDLPDVYSQVQARWSSGANWKFEAFSDGFLGSTTASGEMPNTETRFYSTTGMRLYGEKDSWVALRIKSPGEGDFTVTLNHAVCPNSGTLAMYVLPGDTAAEDIWNATDPANRIGKVVLTNATGETGTEDGFTSFVGYFNFEAGKEYILVLECYDNSMYEQSLCYMNLSQIIMEKGIIEQETSENNVAMPIVVAENVVKVADAGQYSAVSEVNGHDYYFVNLEGGTLLVYDLDTAELVDEVEIGVRYGRYMSVAPDGKVWIVGDLKKLVCYDPYTQTVDFSPNIQSALGYKIICVRAITFDENGIAYFTLNTCNVIRYDPATKEFTDLGELVEGCTYSSGIVYHKGYLYVPYYNPDVSSHIVKYNVETNQIEGMTDIYDMIKLNGVDITGLGVVGDKYLMCGSNYATESALAIDINTMELVEVDLPGGLNLGVTEEIDGKHYLVCIGYGLYEYDVETGVFSKSAGFGNSGIGFRTAGQQGGSSLVTIDGERCLMTYTASGAHPRFYNLDKMEYISWDSLVYGVGGGSDVNSMTVGPEGSNEIYAGTWNTEYCFIYNTELGEVTLQYETVGQTDSMIWYNGKHYAGNYSSTTLNEIYPETLEIIQRFKLDHDLTGQLRPLSMAAGGGYIFVGTIPQSSDNGGAITTYNTATGEWHCERNIIPDQSVVGIAYHDGLVFCGSSRAGGTGAESAGESAMIAAYDYENNEVLAYLDPRDYISGLTSQVEYIYGLAADPKAEENGRIWAIASDVLFCFTFDRESKTFKVQEVLSFSKVNQKTGGGFSWRPITVQFDVERNCIYATFANGGGFRCVEIADWDAPVGSVQVANSERLMGYIPTSFVYGEDGNIYFGISGGDLWMLPLNVTEEDWAIAAQVDQMILAIDENVVSLETEAAIKEARSAYENLSWYYKALVQYEELLKEQETDLLECRIDTIANMDITADSLPVLQEMMDTYEGMNTRQQRYTKNYEALKEAYNTSSDLNDQRAAAAMQKRVDALKDLFPLTLEDEPEVVGVRTDFDALTGSQKLLVDTTILKEAEAQIAALRAEFVKYVETLIQAIPGEITLDAEPAITAAREGVDKLYVLELKEISYSKLESAEAKLRSLKKAKGEADEVDLLIKEIGIVTLGDAERIAEARDAYDSLSDAALSFVTRGKKLVRAEWTLKFLQTWGIPAITIANAGIVFAVLWFVPSFRNKVFKTRKKEEEIIDN